MCRCRGWYLIYKPNWSVVDFTSYHASNERISKVAHNLHNDLQCKVIWDSKILPLISWQSWRWQATFLYGWWKWVNMFFLLLLLLLKLKTFVTETPLENIWFASSANFINVRGVTTAGNWHRRGRDQRGQCCQQKRSKHLTFLILESNSSLICRGCNINIM